MENTESSGSSQNQHRTIRRFLSHRRSPIFGIFSSVLLVTTCGFTWSHWQASRKFAAQHGVWASIDTSRYLLRLSGSKIIGSVVAPQLVTAWLVSIGASDVEETHRVGPNASKIPDTTIRARLNGNPVLVEVKAHDSATGFRDLANGDSDVAMASREINSSEITTLMPLGGMRSRAAEHLLGVEGIMIIVSRSNLISELSQSTLEKIFAGEITNWSGVGMKSLPIHLYAPDNKSRVYNTFVSRILGNVPMANAKSYEDSETLESDVAGDPGGIGIVSTHYVKDTRSVSIRDGASPSVEPTNFAANGQKYALSRPLYLYTAAVPQNSSATDFLRFALSPEGQDIVRKARLDPQSSEDSDLSNTPATIALPRDSVQTSLSEEKAKRNVPAPPAPPVAAVVPENATDKTSTTPRPMPESPSAASPPPPVVAALPDVAIELTKARSALTSASLTAPPVSKAMKLLPPPPIPPVATTSHDVTPEDYPETSMRLHEQGKVIIKYLVKEDGSVGDCNVTTSSGTSRLDDAACAIVKRHWKFKPAMQSGKPVAEFLTAEVVFQLYPSGQIPSSPNVPRDSDAENDHRTASKLPPEPAQGHTPGIFRMFSGLLPDPF